jgi:hypothetical protein
VRENPRHDHAPLNESRRTWGAARPRAGERAGLFRSSAPPFHHPADRRPH